MNLEQQIRYKHIGKRCCPKQRVTIVRRLATQSFLVGATVLPKHKTTQTVKVFNGKTILWEFMFSVARGRKKPLVMYLPPFIPFMKLVSDDGIQVETNSQDHRSILVGVMVAEGYSRSGEDCPYFEKREKAEVDH